jgi:hypothetical protein
MSHIQAQVIFHKYTNSYKVVGWPNDFKTPREAIDAAMDAEEKK